MSIQDQLKDDLKTAMRAGEKQRVEVIRMALAALKNAQIDLVKVAFDKATAGATLSEDASVAGLEIDRQTVLSDEQQLQVISREVKRRRDAVEAYTNAKRPDLAAQEEAEAHILETYLPKQIGADELRPLVAQVIAELGLGGPGDMGKLMPVLMQRLKGQADGRVLSQLARELLTKNSRRIFVARTWTGLRWRSGVSRVQRTTSPFARLSLAAVLLAMGLWLIMVFRLPSDPDIQVGQPSPVTLLAPRSTTFVSEILTQAARERVANNPENQVYSIDRTLPIQQRDRLNELLVTISRVRDDQTLSPQDRAERLTRLPSPDVALASQQAAAIITMSDDEWKTVAAQARQLYSQALSDNNYSLDASTITQIRELYLPFHMQPGLSSVQQELVTLLVSSFLVPNRALDGEATNDRVTAAQAAVAPVQVQVLKDELIVPEGALVTPADMEKLQALGLVSTRSGGLRLLGYGIVASIIALLFCWYVLLFQPAIRVSWRAVLVLVMLMLSTAAAAKLLLPVWRAAPYVFPLAAISMLLSVLFSCRIALIVTVLMSLVLGMLGDQLFSLMAVSSAGGMVGVYCVRKLERSTTFLLAGLAVALTTFFAEVGFWLNGLITPDVEELAAIAMFSAVNGGLSAILALSFANPVGRLAGVVTPMQLLELAHPTQPLLRRLMREAPGTYYHSINVSNLAEAAAEAVGADALLLRVGAYYHDIGKMIRPYFFTDNQIDRSNVHDDLDPHTSVEIIIDHVREGVKMAEQAHLPGQIIDFIRTHHGTSVALQFYHAALQREDTVDISEYSYPGPKPQTKDQAILMLADSVEATVRAKSQHGKLRAARSNNLNGDGRTRPEETQTIEELVGQIIDGRVRSGQLDESPLTLQDVRLIKMAFVNTLQGIYHPRVEYNQPVSSA